MSLGVSQKRLRFLLAQAESRDQLLITGRTFAIQVAKVAAARADNLEQASAGGVIVLVRLEMLEHLVDALAEHGYLDFRGAGILVVGPVFLKTLSGWMASRSMTGIP